MLKDLGRPIALGRTAELYVWDEGRVLKLFYNWFDLEDIQFEQRMAQSIVASGLPVPLAGEIIRVNDRNGLVYARIDGASMWENLAIQPHRLFAFAWKTAELHAGIHANALRPGLPSQRHRLERKNKSVKQLPDHLKQSVLESLSELPGGSSICHGDFHPGNILLAPSGAIVIDWMDASLGNPLADVARTTIILIGSAASSQVPNIATKLLLRYFHLLYLRRYFRLCPGGEQEYRRWLPVVAAARLSENIPELESWLMDQVQ
jgi:hypothetical protein